MRLREARPPARRGCLAARPGEEKFLANIRQLTFGGQNAEAYWSADGKRIIFQSNDEGRLPCDQIFVMNADGSGKRMVSNGKGKTTCSYFFPSGDRILYGSTFRAGDACPPPPDRSRGYVWALDDYDIYTARPDGSDIRPLFSSPAYDAEATVSRDGRKIVFTSARDGDLEVYSMNADGSGVTRLTRTPGYDGGPFYSYDGRHIVYRADHPRSPEDLALYRENLARGTYAPKGLEIRVMNADGSGDHAVTANGAANFAPYFFPDGKRIIFSSNLRRPEGPRLRALRRELRRDESDARDLLARLRRLSDVQLRRDEARLRFQPQRQQPRGDEHLRGRLDREAGAPQSRWTGRRTPVSSSTPRRIRRARGRAR